MAIQLELANLINNLRIFLPLANSHMVSFITKNSFENILPKAIQEEIKTLSVEELNKLVLGSFTSSLAPNDKIPNLLKFLNDTKKISLKHNSLCLTFEGLCEKLGSKDHSDSSHYIIKNLMSIKKTHEVEMMSAVIAVIARSEKCTHLVDVGGGKGYLSSVLTLKHELKVLSIDSSSITSRGAEKQLLRIEKLWKSIQKNLSIGSNSSSKKIKYRDFKTGNENEENKALKEYSRLCRLATHFITDESDILEMIRNSFPEDEIGKVMMVGLHTCGNLAASSLRLFVKNPNKICCLVNVGCCYNLITEEFDINPSRLQVSSQTDKFGFPMSAYLKSLCFSLGRNARMLATQPPDRIAQEGMLDTEALFYRALLEVYLEKKICINNSMLEFRVGKFHRKCTSFTEYVHKSVGRLGIKIEVDDGELQELYQSHSETRKLFHAFFLLKLAVAPAIEAVIMLDRLLFLHEQGVRDAYLTQLFDPVVSPRCFSIIAFNKASST